MGGIGDFVRRKFKFKSKSKAWDLTPGPLPILTPHQPTTLTASPSTHGNYGAFARLPYELRQQILTEAFGGRSLHVNLTFGHPLVRRPPAQDADSGQVARRHCGLGSQLVPDKKQRPSWQWFGCVCHRRMEYTPMERELNSRNWDRYSKIIQPFYDECLKGGFCSCEFDEGTSDSAECFVGVLGWLLACRQACSEAIDILYSTNTFQFSDWGLIQNLPRLLPRQHLSSITSLEMLWSFNMDSSASVGCWTDAMESLWANPTSQDHLLHKVCAMIPRSFPHVRHLYISFQSPLGNSRWDAPQGDGFPSVESVILAPVEEMLRSLEPGPSKEFSIVIQRGEWAKLRFKYQKLYGSNFRIDFDDSMFWGRFWKSLSSSSNQEGGEVNNIGYWLCSGWIDDVVCNFRMPIDY